jgi:hypothetical protein
MKYKVFFLLVLLLFLQFNLNAEIIEKEYYFSKPEITKTGDYYKIQIEDLNFLTRPGKPEIPSKSVTLLLPPVEKAINVIINFGEKINIIGNYQIYPFQEPYPLSFNGKIEFTKPDPRIYNSNKIYPDKAYTKIQTQYFRGHSIALLNLYPIEYEPLTGKISYYTSIKVTIETGSSVEAENSFNNFYRSCEQTKKRVENFIDNIEVISEYPIFSDLRDEDNDYVIITNNTYLTDFNTFIDFKLSQGYNVLVKLTEDIYTEYTGVDNAEKIRNFIKYAYQNLGTEYVLLGGDTEIIPHRGFYVAAGSTIEEDLPSDLYFSGLDRVGTGTGPDWNVDDDSYWGETSEADYYADVFLGRISADTHSEFSSALNKQIMYQNTPVTGDLEKAIMVGENLNNSPLTWGGTYKDEIINGGTYNGYYTTGFPANFTVQTQYDRDGTWSLSSLITKLNNGTHLVNHLGHSSNGYNMKFYTSDVNNTNLTSNGTNHNFYIMYSQGCYPAAFDNRNSSGNYGSDCIVEEFTTIDNGCVVFIGNTRYGWYNPGGTNSCSQYMDRQLFDALFGENIFHIAAMNEDARFDGASQCNGNPWFRWAFYEITLFGDPSLDVWTDTPTDISASYPSSIPLGTTQISFNTDTPDALIGLIQNNELIGNGITDSYGDVTINLFTPVSSIETISASIIAHNKNRNQGDIIVVSNQPYVIYESYQINDSSGNGNNQADFGESILLGMTLENVGNQTAYNVDASLSAVDSYVTITDNTQSYGTILSYNTSNQIDGFAFNIANNIPDQHQIDFNLEITGNARDTWNSFFNITVNAPNIEIGDMTIDDSAGGNGNARLDPGETAEIIIETSNNGHMDSPSAAGTLNSASSYVTINDGAHNFGTILMGNTENAIFNITIDSETPIGTPVDLQYSIIAGSYNINETFNKCVGLILDDFEDGTFNNFEWEFAGDADWSVVTETPFEGVYCVKSGDVGDNQSSDLILSVNVLADGDISFYKKVSSESNYDYLRFFIDGYGPGQWSGEVGWSEETFPVTAGNHTFKWSYDKDSSISNGSDCAWVDYIIFPPLQPPAYPDIMVNPINFNVNLSQGDTTDRNLRISNSGEAELTYDISLDYVSRSYLTSDDNSSVVLNRTSGGPDVYGYTWSDSDEPGGPVYSWRDISSVGSLVNFTHNDYATDFIPIGFTFNYYGVDYDQFRINPNGWIGFGDDWTDYHNYGLPRVDAPRPAIFGFWDDLDPIQGGDVYYYSTADSLVVWFDNVIHYPGIYDGTYDFEIILYSNGNILMQYRTVSGDLDTSTIGIQDAAGTDGLEVAYNENWVHNNLAIEFIKPLNWLNIGTYSGSIPVDNWENITLSINTEDLEVGDYLCNMEISSNDPDESMVSIPVNLNVESASLSIPSNIQTSCEGLNMNISWQSVEGATSYKIYSSDNPYSDFVYEATVTATNWSTPLTENTRFYRITANN